MTDTKRKEAREAYYKAQGRQDGLWEAYLLLSDSTETGLILARLAIFDRYLEAQEVTNAAWKTYSEELNQWLASF